MYTLRLFNNQVEEILIDEEKDLLSSLRDAGLDPICDCSGEGQCGKCKARIVSGNITGMTEVEERLLALNEKSSGWFLMCQRKPLDDLVIDMPQRDGENYDLNKTPISGDIKPFVKKRVVDFNKVDMYGFDDCREFILDMFADLGVKSFEYKAMEKLVPALKAGKNVVTVVYSDRIMTVEAGDTTDCHYAVAMDLGTATVGIKLIDIANGEILGKAWAGNSQRPFGYDAAKRVEYVAKNNGKCKELQNVLVYTVNKLIRNLCSQLGVDTKQIYDLLAVGNPQIIHLLYNIEPQAADAVPMFLTPENIYAYEIELEANEMANVTAIPFVNGEFGGDAAVVCDMADGDETLIIDLGIDTNLILKHNGTQRFKRVSTPVFEGMGIKQGMINGNGAITGYTWNEEAQNSFAESEGYLTPTGISGMGFWSLYLDLKQLGYIGADNKFKTDNLPERVAMKFADGPFGKEMVLSGGGFMKVVLTEKDLAVLDETVNRFRNEVASLIEGLSLRKVILTGAVGAEIKLDVVKAIGLLPDSVDFSIVEAVPEMALSAAVESLISY